MSKMDNIEAYRADAAEALAEASGKSAAGARALVEQIRQKALDAASQARERAYDLGREARERALDLRGKAQDRARGEVVRRRSTAADTLESLADILRPDEHKRGRRLAVIGGSGLALTAAVGVGVALGFALSRQLKARKAQATQASGDTASTPTASTSTTTAAKPRTRATNSGNSGSDPTSPYDAEVGAGLGAI